MKPYIIYIYTKPNTDYIKIGDTENRPNIPKEELAHKRIRQQVNTAGAVNDSDLEYTLLKTYEFDHRDHYIHKILKNKGYLSKNLEKKSSTEWFNISFKKVDFLITELKKSADPEEINFDRFQNFKPRKEQLEAISKTEKAYRSGFKEMLWNAKMRFGKTFTAYQLIKKMNFKKVLVLTYKPAVKSQWREDLENHVDFEGYTFLSKDSTGKIETANKTVTFLSFQDLLGSEETIKDHHSIIFETEFDLIIVDEYHFGAATKKAKGYLQTDAQIQDYLEKEGVDDKKQIEEDSEAIKQEEKVRSILKSKYKLYLSGTPFKALANENFSDKQIFNWTYPDEQKAKRDWDGPSEENPYRDLPEIKMFIYEINEKLRQYALNQENEFSINKFFSPAKGKAYSEEEEDHILLFLDELVRNSNEEDPNNPTKIIRNNKNFPYENRDFETDHTLWYVSNVKTGEALAKSLRKHNVFQNYKIIEALGTKLKSGADSVAPVKRDIANSDKSITISCGMLTTGVSIPEWTAVLFLRDIKSPESYFQTAFRAQTPNKDKGKQVCYIFDFDPTRSLELLVEYADKLSEGGTHKESSTKVAEMINYLPVLQSRNGKMVELSAEDILTYEYMGLTTSEYGRLLMNPRAIKIDSDFLDFLENGTAEELSRLASIFSNIKKFRKSKTLESGKALRDLGSLAENNKVLKKCSEVAEKEKRKVEAKQNKLIEEYREILKAVISRIPLFMYLTGATEDSMQDILNTNEQDLFRKVSGISPHEFFYLVDLGLVKIDNLEGYVIQFKNFEEEIFKAYSIDNSLI